MKVAFVLPSFAGGGAERVAMNLISALDRARFAPEMVVLDGRGPLRSALPEDVPLHDLAMPRLRYALPGLLRTLRRIGPTAVYSSLGYVNVALIALRRFIPGRLVVREANLPSLSLPNAPFPKLMERAYRKFYPRADTVICTSDRMAEEFAEKFAVPSERLVVLPNPVNQDAVRRAASPTERHPGPGVRFVAAGRLTRQKGFDRLIDMFAALPENAHLSILGDGPDAAMLAAQAEKLGLGTRIAFTGFEPAPWARYAGADAFLLSSRWEGMPNAALEALACGTPVIATPESGGIAEVARAAIPGAVALAEAGEPFLRAMRTVAPSPGGSPRASLLPDDYGLAAAVRRFETALAG